MSHSCIPENFRFRDLQDMFFYLKQYYKVYSPHDRVSAINLSSDTVLYFLFYKGQPEMVFFKIYFELNYAVAYYHDGIIVQFFDEFMENKNSDFYTNLRQIGLNMFMTDVYENLDPLSPRSERNSIMKDNNNLIEKDKIIDFDIFSHQISSDQYLHMDHPCLEVYFWNNPFIVIH